MEGSSPADRDMMRTALTRGRLLVTGLAAGVLFLTAVSGFVDFGSGGFADRLALPVALAGLVMLPASWHVYGAMRERAADVTDRATGYTRYGTALLTALGLTAAGAFLGIVVYMMGAGILALTGVFTHVLLTGVLWPAEEKIQPFLGRTGRSFVE